MKLTNYVVEKSNGMLHTEPEQTDSNWLMFDSGSIEVEVAEFLYSLVRLQKPDHILETGTHTGLSALYMALALKDNQKGLMDTIGLQWFESVYELWEMFEVDPYINFHCKSSLNFEPETKYDIVFLDTEPDIRFDELDKFYPFMNPNAFVLIHDLSENLGLRLKMTKDGLRLDLSKVDDMEHWPFGDFRPHFGNKILSHELTAVHFKSPRGLTMFQKSAIGNSAYMYLRSDLK